MAVEWGSVADWFGAVGGVGGAGTAATFYFLDRRRARMTIAAEDRKVRQFNDDVDSHLFILLQGIIDASTNYLNGERSYGLTVLLRAQLAAYAATAIRTQQLPGLSVDRFMDICDLLEAVTDRRIEGRDPEAIVEAVNRVVYTAKGIRETLANALRLDG